MKAGDKVVCIDDEGWIIPDPGFEHLSPKKGCVYVVREFERVGGVAAISLVGGYADHFYRACRFRPATGKALGQSIAKQLGEFKARLSGKTL